MPILKFNNVNNDNHIDSFDEDSSYKCRLCGQHYDNLADMQRHELVSHVQKGNVPKEGE